MKITLWATFAPTLSPLPNRIFPRGACAAMSMAPTWVNLLKTGIAKHKNDPTAKFCQLATAAIEGGASCRTWVFRGFWDDTGALKFIADRRSQKIPEIAADPAGEVCFYLTKTREQFRVKGRLEVVAAGESNEKLAKARRHQWTQISPSSRASFATPLTPGEEKSTGGQVEEEAGRDEDKGAEEETGCPGEPSNDFCLVLLWPNRVDHLVLKDGQTRHVHTLTRPREVDGGGLQSGVGGGGEAGDGENQSEASEGDGRQSAEWKTVEVNP